MERRLVEVVLQGRRFVLRTEAGEEALKDVVAFAETRLEEIGAVAAGLPPHSVALLALLSVSEELSRERRSLAGLRDKIRNKSARILEMLDGVAKTDDGNNPPVGGMSISIVTEKGTP
jgi:cell division protein ZapA (FtsZ GTPase activity inhibitor)